MTQQVLDFFPVGKGERAVAKLPFAVILIRFKFNLNIEFNPRRHSN